MQQLSFLPGEMTPGLRDYALQHPECSAIMRIID
ncbi:antirestriction protein [Escherichia coli]|nr:antirestriction protein [Escherichia coli]